jgi:hypothetical protein
MNERETELERFFREGMMPFEVREAGLAALAEVERLQARVKVLEAEVARLRVAAEAVVDGAAQTFADPRVSYEEWQLAPGSIDALRVALGVSVSEPEPESGWLIESTLSGPATWWQGKRPGTEEQWTAESTRAIRFSRHEDAEACRLSLPDAHVSKVTEHVWLRAALRAPEGGE